tara:strand:- start:13394 stop:14023 length:630 start_codon:yes stop_codon:yes gene_type:complete
MPYCTIEEAWTQSLNPELQEEQSNAINYQPSQNTDLFELDKKLKKKVNRVPQQSRTYKTLDEHSKKIKRNRVNSKRVFIDDTKSNDSNSIESSNFDFTNSVNDMNLQAYKEYNVKSKDLDSNVSVMEDFRENLPNQSGESNESSHHTEHFMKIINELRDENKKLSQTIEKLQKDDNSNKDNFMEATMFIITGIIIILIMENINKLVRKF